MKSVHHRRKRRNASPPTLFEWADSREFITLPFPARVLADRFGLTPQRAVLVAELAGLGARQ
jgi:hypothetical protein